MKKKIYALVAITMLLLFGLAIVVVIEAANENKQPRRDQSSIRGNEDGFPPKRQDTKYPSRNITEITGILQYKNDSFYIESTQLIFGPDEMIQRKASPFDYNGNERIETILGELKGLSGLRVALTGYIEHGNNVKVVEINGMPLEKPPQPPPNIYEDQEGFKIQTNDTNRG